MKKRSNKKKKRLNVILLAVAPVVLIVLWFLFFGPIPVYDHGFKTVDDLAAYAKTINEFVPMENRDGLKPSYEKYYKKKFTYTFIDKFFSRIRWVLVKIRVMKAPPFSFGFLKKQLEDLAVIRKKAGFKGNFVQKIDIAADSQLVVVGVLQGAYHSLTRDLTKMYELGIITKDLKITNPKTHILFLGNVVNRSPYTSETLSVVLSLLQKNPEQVIYFKGTNEFDFYWVQHTLRRELELGAKFLSKEKIPLFKQVSAFFSTLPLELYGTMNYKKTAQELPYIVISAFIEDKELRKKTQEKLYPKFLFDNAPGSPNILDVDNIGNDVFVGAEKRIVLMAVIRDIRKRDSFEKMDGLRSMAPEDDALSWTILSCPTAPYRIGLKFMYDAFGVVTGGKNFEDWKLTLYNRHVEKGGSEFKSRVVPFIGSGKKIVGAPAVDQEKKPDTKKNDQPKKVEPKKVKPEVVEQKTKEEPEPKQDMKKPETMVQVEQKPKLKEVKDIPAKKEEQPAKVAVQKEVTVVRPGITKEQVAFYKELVSQVKTLKKEVAGVRESIIKELQKFETPDSTEQKKSSETKKEKPQELEKMVIPLVAEKQVATAQKRDALDQAKVVGNKLEESIEKVLTELKSQRSGITINNNSVDLPKRNDNVGDTKVLLEAVSALQQEFKAQRELIKNIVVEENTEEKEE